jgi:hypothetical protein
MLRVSLFGNATPRLRRLQEYAVKHPELAMQSIVEHIVPFIERRLDVRLRKAIPGPVTYPIQWTSERQRRAFFATDGFGHGIPYHRTGGVAAAWRLVVTATLSQGVTVVARNDSPAAPFVYGAWKQVFHTNTGWPDARPILDQIAAETQPALMEDQIVLARSFFGTEAGRGG